MIYGLNYSPELTGIGKYSGEMAEWLSQQGHDVRVVTAPPYYPEWQVPADYNQWSYKRTIGRGEIDVWRCPLYVPSKPSGLKRIIHLASFALSSFPIMLRQLFWRADVVIVIEPALFCAPAAWLTARLSGAKCWLHVQDFEVDAAFDLGILSSGWLRSLVLKIEKVLMRCFDRVSTISDQMINRLGSKGVLTDRQVFFPNWVDVDHIFPLKTISKLREQLEIPSSDIVYLYSGNMGEKQGLEIIVEAARRLIDHKNIIFVMCGHGAAYPRLRELAEGLENIHWLPLQPLDKLNDLLNMADVHLLPQKADAADLVMPSKLTGMLASGCPVLATVFEETQIAEVLESSGVIVPPEDTDAFVTAILKLAENAEQRQEFGKNAREYAVKNLGRDAVLSQFEDDLRAVIKNGLRS